MKPPLHLILDDEHYALMISNLSSSDIILHRITHLLQLGRIVRYPCPTLVQPAVIRSSHMQLDSQYSIRCSFSFSILSTQLQYSVLTARQTVAYNVNSNRFPAKSLAKNLIGKSPSPVPALSSPNTSHCIGAPSPP